MKSSLGIIIDDELIKERRMAFMSHLDLSSQLQQLVQKTHIIQISSEELERIKADLQNRLSKYGK